MPVLKVHDIAGSLNWCRINPQLIFTAPHLLFHKHLFSRRTTDCLHLVSTCETLWLPTEVRFGRKTSFTHSGNENTHKRKRVKGSGPTSPSLTGCFNLCQTEVHFFIHCSSSQDFIAPPLRTYQMINNKQKARKKRVVLKKAIFGDPFNRSVFPGHLSTWCFLVHVTCVFFAVHCDDSLWFFFSADLRTCS